MLNKLSNSFCITMKEIGHLGDKHIKSQEEKKNFTGKQVQTWFQVFDDSFKQPFCIRRRQSPRGNKLAGY